MGGALPKQYLPLAGRPLLAHTMSALAGHPEIDAVRAMIHPDDHGLYEKAAAGLALMDPADGGAGRQASVLNGLESLEAHAPDRVLIHDGVRPFVGARVIEEVLAALDHGPAAIAALPVADTLKKGVDGRVAGTVTRDGLWRAQTPQGFHFQAILEAHRQARGHELTDDAAVAERAGLPVSLVAGSEDNFKVTTPADFDRAERVLAGAGADIRVGTGFDAHRFRDGDQITLCGLKLRHDQGLAGHSDADVAIHALVDALLGAIGAGDIGQHFPPTDARWANADSSLFLARARDLVGDAGAAITNVDVTLICERPRIGPHRAAMRDRLAEILALAPERVNVKATTTEGLGFAGRREGIVAQATATVRFGE